MNFEIKGLPSYGAISHIAGRWVHKWDQPSKIIVTPEMEAVIRQMRADGYGHKEIGNRFGVSDGFISRYLIKRDKEIQNEKD